MIGNMASQIHCDSQSYLLANGVSSHHGWIMHEGSGLPFNNAALTKAPTTQTNGGST